MGLASSTERLRPGMVGLTREAPACNAVGADALDVEAVVAVDVWSTGVPASMCVSHGVQDLARYFGTRNSGVWRVMVGSDSAAVKAAVV
jgi:hypothetical protein